MSQYRTGKSFLACLCVAALAMLWGMRSSSAAVSVLTPDGAEAAGADACVASGPKDSIRIDDGQFLRKRTSVHIYTADASGVLPVATTGNPKRVLVVLHDTGYAQIAFRDIPKTGSVRLTAWATLDGVVKTGSKPAAEQEVMLSWIPPEGVKDDDRIYWRCLAISDDTGHFSYGRVIPGRYSLSKVLRYPDSPVAFSRELKLELKPGDSVHTELGGGGRQVIGQVTLPNTFPKDWLPDEGHLIPCPIATVGKPGYPAGWFLMSDAEVGAWREKPEVKAESDRFLRSWMQIPVGLSRTGQITAEDVPPGAWRLTIRILKPPVDESRRNVSQRCFAEILGEVVVPPGPDEQPVQLTKYRVRPIGGIQPGDIVPPFVIPGLTGEPVKLADYSGRVVVLFFWSHYGWNARKQLPVIKEFHARHRDERRVAIIGINRDWDVESARAAVVENHMDWPNARPSGAWQDDEIPDEFGVHLLDQVWIITPKGQLWVRDLSEPADIRRALAAALEEPDPANQNTGLADRSNVKDRVDQRAPLWMAAR